MTAGSAAEFSGLEALSLRFKTFAESECRDASPLYLHLSEAIAEDSDILELASHCREGQPAPNLLFAAVHLLVIQNADVPLARFYADLSTLALPPNAAYPDFRAFCLANRADIIRILSTRRVQTNEIRRCAYLYPAFCLIAALADERPLALVEIGTSAGINLLWDCYSYRYSHGQEVIRAGRVDAAVLITSTLRGDVRPVLPATPPCVQSRIGIDLNTLNANSAADALWLRALVWPENAERLELLQNALPVVQRSSLTLLAGNGVELLPNMLEALPPTVVPVVFHTHTVNQMSPGDREQLTAIIADAGTKRAVYRLANDIGGGGKNYSALKLLTYSGKQEGERHLANVDGHARWIEWLDAAVQR